MIAPTPVAPAPRRRAGIVGYWQELVLFLLVMVAYAPAYLRDYAWSDDYPVVMSAGGHSAYDVTDHLIAGGRPLLVPVFHYSFGSVHSIEGLRVLRLLGVIGVALVALVIYRALTRAGLSWRLALPTAAATCFLPTFQTWAAWATPWPTGFEAALAGVGGLWLSRPPRRFPPWAQLVAPMAAIAASFLCYQPATMFVWVPIGAQLLLGDEPWPQAWRAFLRQAATVVAALAVGAIIALAVTKVTDTPVLPRAALLRPADMPGKLVWFVSRPVVMGARPFIVSSPSPIGAAAAAIPVLGLLVVGLYLRGRGSRAERLGFVALALVLVPVSMAPNLIVRENQIDFRILPGLAPLMLLYLVLAVRGVVTRLAVGWSPATAERAVAALAWVMVALAGVGAWRLVDELFIAPSQQTEAYFRHELASFDPSTDDRIVVVVPTGWPARDRLGIYSTRYDLAHTWVPEPLVQLVLEGRGITWPASRIRVVERPPAKDSGFVVDTTPLLSSGAGSAQGRGR